MARPIPHTIPIEELSKLIEDIKPRENKSFIDITINGIRNKSTKSLIVGTFTGWVTGLGVVRVGKIAAFGLGGGVLILHFASEGGYIQVNWEKIKEAASQSQAWMEKTMSFVKRNSCFSVGFVGGFFFGIAST